MEREFKSLPRTDLIAEVWRNRIILAAIIILAASFRFVGLKWGLPNSLHSYSYHPDEFLIVGAAFLTIYLSKLFLPRFYNYPSLFLYLCALAYAVAFGYGMEADDVTAYLIPRIVTATMGVAAVMAVYWAGKSLYNSAVGYISALILAIAPLHVQHSHFGTVDVPCTLFVALALGYAGCVLKDGKLRDYLFSGAMAGLAAGTKYNAGVVLLAVFAAHFLRSGFSFKSIRSAGLWLSATAAAAAFIISTPGSLLQTPEFIHGFLYELSHAAEGHGLVFAGTGIGFGYVWHYLLWQGLSPLLTLIATGSAIFVAVKRNRPGIVILAFAVPYFILISFSQVRFARYTLPLFPAAALLCAVAMSALWNSEKQNLKWRWIVLSALIVFITVAYTVKLDMQFTQPDPRDEAAQWIKSNIHEGASIALPDYPWFYTPPLSPDFGFGTLPQRRDTIASAPYDIMLFRYKHKWKTMPQWVIYSDYEVDDALRLKNNRSLSASQKHEVKRILGELKYIKENYTLEKHFGGPGRAGYRSNLPHDMKYPSPVIYIYKRK